MCAACGHGNVGGAGRVLIAQSLHVEDVTSPLPERWQLEIEELSVGFRPGTPDNAPAIGPSSVQGLTWATGHYRNGILLAPLTAEMVVGLLAGGERASELLAACAPGRFAPREPGPPVEALG